MGHPELTYMTVDVQSDTTTLEIWYIFINLNIPAILGIYLKQIKTYIHKNTCNRMFIEALFITDKHWKQSKCLSTGNGKQTMSIQYNTTEQ